MKNGQTFHIKGNVTISELYLINEKNEKTQTVQDVLNSISKSIVFENIIAEETENSKWLKGMKKKYSILTMEDVILHYELKSKAKLYVLCFEKEAQLLDMSVPKEQFLKLLKNLNNDGYLFGKEYIYRKTKTETKG